MFVNRKPSFFPIIVLMALLGLFAFTSPAHAEDIVPPESGTPAETQSEEVSADGAAEQAAEPQPEVITGDAPAGEVEVPTSDPVELTPETPPEVLPAEPPAGEVDVPAPDVVGEPAASEIPDPSSVEGQPQDPVVEAPPADSGLPAEQADLVVVNSEGDDVPLATLESEAILATGDPYFTVGSNTYSFYKTGGCTGVTTFYCEESATPIQAALDYMVAHSLTPTDRKLYVEADTYNETVIIDGSQSGVSGLTGLVGLGTSPEAVTINGSLIIKNFLNSFSVTNIFVSNTVCTDCAAILAENNNGQLKFTDVKATASGADGIGIRITHNGSLELNRVNATGSGYDGVLIENTGTGALIIKNSSFSGNGSGLYIKTNGAVTLTGVSANDNYEGFGATITSKGLTVNQSIFSNNAGNGLVVDAHTAGGNTAIQNSQFNNNGESGLNIHQNGNVAVSNIRATSNQSYGLFVDTCDWSGVDGTFCRNPFTGSVSILKSTFAGNVISDDGMSGIYVFAKGSIVVTDVYSGLNGDSIVFPEIAGYGAQLLNNRSLVPAAVTVTGSTFSNNNQTGLSVFSKGIITVTDISASDNANEGAILENNAAGVLAGISILASPDVVNKFNYNQDNGLKINSNGAVVLNAVNADGNIDGTGIIVNNAGGTGLVTMDGVRGTSVSNNGGDGIWVVSEGLITLKNMDVSWNTGYGVILDNLGGSAGVNILATLPRWYNGFENNGEDGLFISTNGAVVVQKTKANANTHNGAFINNSTGLANVSISDSYFNNNGQEEAVSGMDFGLFVQTKGVLALTNINANGNGKSVGDVYAGGAWLDNSTAPAAKAITLARAFFMDNFGSGLEILASGPVTFKIGTVSNNESSGATINNSTSIANQNVTIDTVNFWGSGKGEWGLKILSKGNIAIIASEVNNFDGDGTILNNTFGTGTPTVSISGARTPYRSFGFNAGTGLTIDTNGSVSLSLISLDENGGAGAQITTNGLTTSVTLTNVDIIGNGIKVGEPDKFGLNVKSRGNITLDNVQVSENDDYGVKLDNSNGSGTVLIKSLAGREIRDNTGFGLWVISKGNIVLTNISVKNNDGFGAWLDNRTGSAGTVTLNNTLYTGWQGNGDFGLKIDAKGAVLVNLVDAYMNEGTNAIINNTYATGTATPAVTITNSWFDESQDGSGLDVNSKGNISITNVVVNGNVSGHGAFLNNGGDGGKGNVTITGISADDRRSFNGNDTYGLQVVSKGTVTLKFVDASGNGSYGASIDNSAAATPLGVTIVSANFDGNSAEIPGFGLRVSSKGLITATEVYALNNGDVDTQADGMLLDNCKESGGYCAGTGAVTLTNAGAHGNSGDGMNVDSFGTMTLLNVGAGWNGLNGADFHNNYTIHPLLVDIKSTAGISLSLPAGYSSANGVFSDNIGFGLMITSNGAVNVAYANVTGNGTTGDAAFIDNSSAATPMPVTISKSKFSNNNSAGRGILVVSKGAITFTNNEVRLNNGTPSDTQGAAELYNSAADTPQNVTVISGIFQDNASGDGLHISTKGNVLLTNIQAVGNAFDGVEVDARYGNGTVTLNGSLNIFNLNGDNGLEITANGNVVVTNITAEYNKGDGLAIDNCGFDGTVCAGTGTGTISVTNANLNRNDYNGIRASSNGVINLNNVTGLGNGTGAISGTKTFDGAHLITNARDITITNSSFSGNGGSGIWSDTGGAHTNTLKLIGTSYSGNNRKLAAHPNLFYTGLVAIS